MGNLTLNGSTSGQITISPPAVAGTNTITLPAATGTVLTTAGGQTISGTTTVSTLNATTIQVGGNQAVNGPAFSAYPTSTQTISVGTNTKLVLNAKEFDTNNNFDSTTNYRFTPTVAGYYQFSGFVSSNGSAQNTFGLFIYKNGSNFKEGVQSGGSAGMFSVNVTALIYLNGSTDYVELWAYTGSSVAFAAGATGTCFQGVLVRGA